MTIETVRAGFIAWMQARRLAAATVRQYLMGVDRFAREQQGVDLRALGRREMDAYMAVLGRTKLRQATVTLHLRGLKRFFEYLVASQQLLVSPMDHWRERKSRALVGRTLSEKEAARLCQAPNTSLPMGIRDRALVELLYATGLRAGELIGLEVFDVDLAGGLVRVRLGKGGKERFVPIGESAQKWLGEYLTHIRPRISERGGDAVRRLFLNRFGHPMNHAAIGQLLLRYSQLTGIARVSCHTLRRTVATALLRNGADVPTVAELLGHSTLSTTQRYTKVVASDVRATHAKAHPRGGGGSPSR